MNLRKSLFILLSIAVVCVWTVVLIYAVPAKGQHIAEAQSQISQQPLSTKAPMHRERPLVVQTNDKKEIMEDFPDTLDNAIYHLSSGGTISIDVLLDALDEIDS